MIEMKVSLQTQYDIMCAYFAAGQLAMAKQSLLEVFLHTLFWQ